MPPLARIPCFLLALLSAFLPCAPASGQAAADELSRNSRISLITILPGNDVYSLWGHSALRVLDPEQGIDRSYNYGTFSFEESWFVPKFMYGALDYQLGVHDFTYALEHYRSVERRPVIEQVLDLSLDQRNALYRFLEINYRPENRYYRYNFLFDNCSTRVRDALERALGSSVHFTDEPDPGLSFRELLDPYQSRPPFLDAGIDWLLGAPVDRVALPFETMFLPDYLMAAFDRAEVDGRPLVASTDTLFWIEGRERRGGGFPWATLTTWLLLAAGLLVTVRGIRRGAGAMRWFDGTLFLVVGVAGVLITFLWFVSLHDATKDNWHLLWAWPTHLAAGALLLRKRPMPEWLRRYLLAAATVALLAAAGGLIAAAGAPLWPQAFHPAVTAIALLTAVRGGAIFLSGRGQSPAATTVQPVGSSEFGA